MKKLNRKGFTLIELLAIIVILAIIMVVTIPTVLGSMNKARANQLQNAADSAAEWFTKQYELASMGTFVGGADAAFNTFVGTSFRNLDVTVTKTTDAAGNVTLTTFEGDTIKTEINSSGTITSSLLAGGTSTEHAVKNLTDVVLEAAGIANADESINISTELASYVYYNESNKKICVQLTAKDGGSFYVNGDAAYTNVAQSSGCA